MKYSITYPIIILLAHSAFENENRYKYVTPMFPVHPSEEDF